MAYASDSDLTTRVPATLAVSSTLRGIALSDAEAMIDDEQYGLRTVLAHVMLAAHYLLMTPNSGMTGNVGGIVSARSAGEISVSYAVKAIEAGDPTLATTDYGRAYLDVWSSLVSIPEVG